MASRNGSGVVMSGSVRYWSASELNTSEVYTRFTDESRCEFELLVELDRGFEIEFGGLASNSDTCVGIEFW